MLDNHLLKLLELYPKRKWNWDAISENPNFTWEHVLKIIDDEFTNFLETGNSSSKLNWSNISKNQNVTWEIVQKYPYYKWNFSELKKNPNITTDIIKKNINSFGIFYYNIYDDIHENTNLTWKFVEKNRHIYWDYKKLAQTLDIPFDVLLENKFRWFNTYRNRSRLNSYSYYLNDVKTTDVSPEREEYDKLCDNKDFWQTISSNPNITWDIVEKHFDEPWDWTKMYKNPYVTWQIIQNILLESRFNHENRIYIWYNISMNPNITWDIVCQNPNQPWDWEGLSLNPNMTWQIISENIDKSWNFHCLSKNKFNQHEFFKDRNICYL